MKHHRTSVKSFVIQTIHGNKVAIIRIQYAAVRTSKDYLYGTAGYNAFSSSADEVQHFRLLLPRIIPDPRMVL